jgi:hypothetical protein
MSCPTSDRQFPMDEPHPYREAPFSPPRTTQACVPLRSGTCASPTSIRRRTCCLGLPPHHRLDADRRRTGDRRREVDRGPLAEAPSPPCDPGRASTPGTGRHPQASPRGLPAGVGGRLFVTRAGRAGVSVARPFANPQSMGIVYRICDLARREALTAAECASPLAKRPYDLPPRGRVTLAQRRRPGDPGRRVGQPQRQPAPSGLRVLHCRSGRGVADAGRGGTAGIR